MFSVCFNIFNVAESALNAPFNSETSAVIHSLLLSLLNKVRRQRAERRLSPSCHHGEAAHLHVFVFVRVCMCVCF